jgi:5'-nucleotidase
MMTRHAQLVVGSTSATMRMRPAQTLRPYLSRDIQEYSRSRSSSSSSTCLQAAATVPGTVTAATDADHSHENHIKRLKQQIFCNIELNGEALDAVGFDMDFTLAQYNEAFDMLAFEGAKDKLVNKLGYPSQVLDFKYDVNAFRRGLIIDKKRGNIIKVDRHKYVRDVFHGLYRMDSAERKAAYGMQVSSFTDSNYANVDTLFLLIDCLLFASLVDLKDSDPSAIPTKTYEQIYRDVRQSVDLCHRDGVIKDTVMKNPADYIIYDENLVPMLKRIRSSGKKVFLLTNSMYEYTEVVMEYLLHGKGEYKDEQWKDLFDMIIVGGCKPAFLTDDYLSLFRVSKSGTLENLEDKESVELQPHDKVFQGGCWQDLHRMLKISSGDSILYVGDHMYSDILRSKRTLGWRTCLIIPELENELEVAELEIELSEQVVKLRR